MSTRSIIARKTDEGFEGVYHHWDGYPTALGFTLYHMYNKGASLNGMLSFLIDDHPAGWSSINGVDWKKPIGFIEKYDPDNRDTPQCFCHGDRNEDADPITQDTNCGAEFAYVFEKSNELETDLMHIYEKQFSDGKHTTEFFGMTADGGKWVPVFTIDLLLNQEPDWENIGGSN